MSMLLNLKKMNCTLKNLSFGSNKDGKYGRLNITFDTAEIGKEDLNDLSRNIGSEARISISIESMEQELPNMVVNEIKKNKDSLSRELTNAMREAMPEYDDVQIEIT